MPRAGAARPAARARHSVGSAAPRRRGARRTVAALGEFGLLDRLLPSLPGGRGVVLGAGDDCAIVALGGQRLLFTVDALVEGVHFRPAWMTPSQIGRKLFAVNASDVAAMGGRPRWCVLDVGAPGRTAAADLLALARAAAAAAAEAGAVLVGGNLTSAPALSATLALIGEAPPRPVLRRGARPGDLLYVTGTLGDAALGLRALRRDAAARGVAVRRFRAPTPRLRAGALLARGGLARAMIDVSDGLVQDLGHVCAASGVGARIELARVPASAAVRAADVGLALTGGEDYELLCAVAPASRGRAERVARRFGCRFTRIGVCTPGAGVRVVDAQGRPVALDRLGHRHFAATRPRF
jgi:thiamine-monophosphate kinase